jgi:hypothetical protein
MELPSWALQVAALGGAIWFVTLQPRTKVLVAFLFLSSLFDLVPNIVGGFYVRDPGFIMLFIAWLHLQLKRRATRLPSSLLSTAIAAMVVWGLICAAYGILINDYPVLLTLKAARLWVLGYATFFVFIRLYETDPGALRYLLKWLYRITLVLMPVVILQNLTGVTLFFGLVREYAGAVRALPVFLPIIWLFSWYILLRAFSGQRLRADEQLYLAVAITVTALTYTRGIYLAYLAIGLLLLFTLRASRRLRLTRALGVGLAGAALLGVLLVTGSIERVANRFASGVSVISGDVAARTYADDVDTFTGRLLVVTERLGVVADENVVFGFGFIHETLVPDSVRSLLRYGGPINTPEYARRYAQGMPYVMSLHQVDIGWADIVTDMGFPALLFTLTAMYAIFVRQFRIVAVRRDNGDAFFWASAFFLQVAMLILLMFNGNPFVQNVHMACFMLASFMFVSRDAPVERPIAEDIRHLLETGEVRP